jgi:hypothetical protein
MTIHKGSIIAMYREKRSEFSLFSIEDDLRGKVLTPCEGSPTARALAYRRNLQME